MNSSQKPPQVSLLLRLLGGGYLVYLAYDLIKSSQGDVKFIFAAAVFGVVGAVLFVHSLLTLVRSDYFRNSPPPKDEETTEE